MDIIIEWIVRLMVWLSSPRFIGTSGFGALLSRLGIVRYEKWQPGQKLKLLLVGYNGARNTGADARVDGRPEQRERLYRKSLSLGRWLRRLLSDRSDQSVTELIIQLYRNIGIQMEGQLPEHIRVTRCFFSQHYPSSTCAIASLMDRGIIEGLCGRGQLIFSERITEGQPCCICHLKTSVTV